MPKILCIESATGICSVALAFDGVVRSIRETSEENSHARKLTLFVSEVLNEAGESLNSIDAVAVSSGPGSYTGLRIGVSTAKGLCFAANLPLIGVPTLEALTDGALQETNKEAALYCPMIDARRMEVYSMLADKDGKVLNPVAANIIDSEFLSNIIDKIYFFGDGAAKCREVLSGRSNFMYLPGIQLSAQWLAKSAERKFKSGNFENISLFEPFYLKEFKAGLKKQAR